MDDPCDSADCTSHEREDERVVFISGSGRGKFEEECQLMQEIVSPTRPIRDGTDRVGAAIPLGKRGGWVNGWRSKGEKGEGEKF
jgi:hypothetical protein